VLYCNFAVVGCWHHNLPDLVEGDGNEIGNLKANKHLG
jgi:hypothetical protein